MSETRAIFTDEEYRAAFMDYLKNGTKSPALLPRELTYDEWLDGKAFRFYTNADTFVRFNVDIDPMPTFKEVWAGNWLLRRRHRKRVRRNRRIRQRCSG